MTYRAPDVGVPLGLGVGMDLPWRPDKIGFRRTGGGEVAPKVRNFLAKYQSELSTIFFAYQPKDRCRLSLDNYRAAYDSLYEACPDIPVRGFHHTMLNMGAVDAYDPRAIIGFTNALIEQYGFRWIVEDLGIWSIQGKALPYPLPAAAHGGQPQALHRAGAAVPGRARGAAVGGVSRVFRGAVGGDRRAGCVRVLRPRRTGERSRRRRWIPDIC